MPPPFGRRPGGIASPVSFSTTDPRGNGFDGVLLGRDVADVFLYVVRLADVAGVDLGAEAPAKPARKESLPGRWLSGCHSRPALRSGNMSAPPSGGSEPRPNGLPSRTCPHPGDHG
jgi:hypothetical protein